MNKLILVLAGSSAWEESLAGPDDRRLQGTLPLPLSQAGKNALRQIAAYLQQEKLIPEIESECLYSSGNESSGSTADYLARLCRLKTKKLPSLCELNCGLWQGLRIGEIKKRYGRAYRQWRNDPASVCPPEGEAIQEACNRIKGAMETISKKNHGGTVVIVAAQIAAALIECCLTGCDLEQLWRITAKQAPLRIFERNGQSCWQVREAKLNTSDQNTKTSLGIKSE